MSSTVCPSCSANDLKKLSLIYMSGTYDTRGTSRGIVLSGEGLGIFKGRSRRTHESKLSKRLAPPQKRRLLKPLVYGVAGVFCLPFVRVSHQAWNALFIGYCAVIALYLAGRVLYNLLGYPGALRRWESSFMCQRCGAIIQPQSSAASQTGVG